MNIYFSLINERAEVQKSGAKALKIVNYCGFFAIGMKSIKLDPIGFFIDKCRKLNQENKISYCCSGHLRINLKQKFSINLNLKNFRRCLEMPLLTIKISEKSSENSPKAANPTDWWTHCEENNWIYMKRAAYLILAFIWVKLGFFFLRILPYQQMMHQISQDRSNELNLASLKTKSKNELKSMVKSGQCTFFAESN